jgi:hypothetical protein
MGVGVRGNFEFFFLMGELMGWEGYKMGDDKITFLFFFLISTGSMLSTVKETHF